MVLCRLRLQWPLSGHSEDHHEELAGVSSLALPDGEHLLLERAARLGAEVGGRFRRGYSERAGF